MPLCSLNEHSSTAAKAARAAGLDWGLSEETARACTVLAARGLPLLLPRVLSSRHRRKLAAPQNDGVAKGLLRPPASFNLCPILAGAQLADRAANTPLPWRLENVACPLLLAPFMQRAAGYVHSRSRTSKGTCLKLSWPGTTIYVDPANIWQGTAKSISTPRANVKINISPRPRSFPLPENLTGAFIPAADWRKLQTLAAQTYVPATAKSRQGAGAGEVDND